VGPAEVAGWALHLDETAFGNDSGSIVRFGALAKFVEPVRSVSYCGIRDIVALRHYFKLRLETNFFYHKGHPFGSLSGRSGQAPEHKGKPLKLK